MKKDKCNQLPPNLYNFWVRKTTKDGAIIKKKIITNIKIIINKETKTDKTNDDEDRKFYLRIIYNLIKLFWII